MSSSPSRLQSLISQIVSIYSIYFVEAEIDPASKPLVLWLNGGPDCPSLGVGAFYKNGPFRPSENGLVRNEYSWNRGTDLWWKLLYCFSYSANSSSYEGVSDKITVCLDGSLPGYHLSKGFGSGSESWLLWRINLNFWES